MSLHVRNNLASAICRCFLGVLALGFLSGSTIQVQAAPFQIEESLIGEIVQAHVKNQLPASAQSSLSVEVDRVPGAPFLYPEEYTAEDITIQANSNLKEHFNSRAIVRVSLKDKSGSTKEVGVPVHITLKQPVWVVKNMIYPGQGINSKDLTLETRDVSRYYYSVVSPKDDLSEFEARVVVRPGMMLDRRQLIHPPAVRRNQPVKISLKNGNTFQISVEGLAMEDGRIGQTVRVRNLKKMNQYYSGQVVAKNRVEVAL
ncbi:MAG: flagellar basal body P-ring formation chaperone FlgA [Candidatus Melainabacteria bacterium]|nr:flagellar basal body P-ring formation chaperone FlgA [Candidatus Melainabacteria bacterium]